jgi:hypothetical protein
MQTGKEVVAMAKTRQEKIASYEAQITKLSNRKNAQLQKLRKEERNAKTKRLIKRGAILESLIEDAAELTNDQIHFLLKAIITTDQAQSILLEMKEQNPQTPAALKSD